jgi:hypothetical protein
LRKNEKFKENGLEKRKKWKNRSDMDSLKLCEKKLKKEEGNVEVVLMIQ